MLKFFLVSYLYNRGENFYEKIEFIDTGNFGNVYV